MHITDGLQEEGKKRLHSHLSYLGVGRGCHYFSQLHIPVVWKVFDWIAMQGQTVQVGELL